MAAPQQEQATATVLQALQALYHDPDAQAKKRANDWLQEFQHSVRILGADNNNGRPSLTKARSYI